MKTRKNLSFVVLSMLLILALLVACVPQTGAPAGDSAADSSQSAGGGAGEKTKITWWSESTTDQYRELIQKEFIDTFNAAHPDLELEFQWIENLNDQMRTAIQGGAAPDIIQTPGPSFVLEYVNAGHIASLDDFAVQYSWKDKLLGWAYDSGTLQGKLYSLPLTYETMVLYYNKALFAEKGWETPKSAADIEKICEAATAEEIACFSHSNQYWKGVNEWMVGVWYNNFSGADHTYAALQGEKKWTDEEFVGAIEQLKSYVDKGWFSGSVEQYFSLSHDDIWNALCSKKAAMNIEGTWAFQDAPGFCADDWDWVAIPSLREGVTPGYLLAIGSTLSINANSANPDGAAAVLDWIVNDRARAAKIIEGFNFGEWNVPLHFELSDFSANIDERFTRFVSDFAKVTGDGNFGYTTWTFWPAKTDNYIIQELDAVFTGDITPVQYQEEQQKLFDAEKSENKVPPSPPTKSSSK